MQALPGSDVAHVIQLSVAPVFLLSGVGALLAVLSNRLGRIIDRARTLEDRLESLGGTDKVRETELHGELMMLSLRARLIYRAIFLCTTSALLVAAVVVSLFVAAFFTTQVSLLIAVLFIAAMLALIGALLSFLREVYVGTRSLTIGPRA